MLPDFVNILDVHMWVKNQWTPILRQHLSELGLNSTGKIKTLKDRLIRYIERAYFGADVLWGPNDEEDLTNNINSPKAHSSKESRNTQEAVRKNILENVQASAEKDTCKPVDKSGSILTEKSETSTAQDSCFRNRNYSENARQSSLLALIPPSSSLSINMYNKLSTEDKETAVSHNNVLCSEQNGEQNKEAVASLQDEDKIYSCTQNSGENSPTGMGHYDKPDCDNNRKDSSSSRGLKRPRGHNSISCKDLYDLSEQCTDGWYRNSKIARDDRYSSLRNRLDRNEEEEEFRFQHRSTDNQDKESSPGTRNQGYQEVIDDPIDLLGSDWDRSDYQNRVNGHMNSCFNFDDYASNAKENGNQVLFFRHDYEKSNQVFIDKDPESDARGILSNKDGDLDVCVIIKKDVSQDEEDNVGLSQDTCNAAELASQIIQDNQLEAASNIYCSTLETMENPVCRAVNFPDIQKYTQHCFDGSSYPTIHHRATDCTGSMVLRNMVVELAKKWQIKFTGQGGCTVQEFINKVNMHRKDLWITDVELLKVLPSWLEGRAAQWWNMAHHRWRNWSDFLTDFEIMYVGPSYQKRVREELRLRTQGSKESLMDYLISVQNIMSHLRPPMSEREKLDLIMDNLHPDMYPYFPPTPFRSMEEAQEQMMVIDARRDRARFYRVPPTPQDSFFPENAYKKKNAPKKKKASKKKRVPPNTQNNSI